MENKEKEISSPMSNEVKPHFADRANAYANSIKNPVGRAFMKFFVWIAIFFVDFYESIKRSPSKLAGIFIALPAIFISFSIERHKDALNLLTAKDGLPSFLLFVLVLFSVINIFNAVSVSSKKNLSSACVATATTLVLTFSAIYYYVRLNGHSNKGLINMSSSAVQGSMIFIFAGVIFALAGCVMAFIFMNKKHKKETK